MTMRKGIIRGVFCVSIYHKGTNPQGKELKSSNKMLEAGKETHEWQVT